MKKPNILMESRGAAARALRPRTWSTAGPWGLPSPPGPRSATTVPSPRRGPRSGPVDAAHASPFHCRRLAIGAGREVAASPGLPSVEI